MRYWILSFLFFCATASSAHGGGDEPTVVLEPEINETVKAGTYSYRFQLFDTVANRILSEAELELTHERRLHLFVFDPALREFQHVHPEYDGTYWKADLSFAVSGNYWVWAEAKVAGGDGFQTPARLKVELTAPAWPTPPRLSDSRTGNDGQSRVELSPTRLKAGKMATLDLRFSRLDGSLPAITPYLGAIAHVVAVPDDADSLVHVHPMDTGKAGEAMLHVTFPARGFYRLWIEFVDEGELKRVPLSVQVH